MDRTKLIKAREYYDLTSSGTPKEEAALEVFDRKNVEAIESTPEYLAIVSAAGQVERAELRKEMEAVKRKQIRSYSKLLDKGEELMDEAKTVSEKVLAQQNQRDNLSSGIVENAIAWDGMDRNQEDLGDVLEGVIL